INIVNISTKTYHSIVIVILFILTLGLYYQALSGFWRWDDGYIALHVFKHPGFDNFYVPNVWQKFSRAYLTPWIVFSFNLDLTLFGFSATAFYIHQLISLWLVSIATYFLLSLWVSNKWAFLGSLLFLGGTPVITVVEQLMTRHYNDYG
ncbi:MAG: hypothetical protein DRQ49_16435, partial [Gammaproteobacteria bacterium]